MFFGGTLCLLTIPVRDADDSEPSLLVGGQMRIVDDPSGTHNTDAVIQALRQFGFVFKVRKDVSHSRIPWDAFFVSGQQFLHADATANSNSNRTSDQRYLFLHAKWETFYIVKLLSSNFIKSPSRTCARESLSATIQPF